MPQIKHYLLHYLLFLTLGFSTPIRASSVYQTIVDTLVKQSNLSPITGQELNTLDGIDNALNIDYTIPLQSATYVDRTQPTIQEIQSVIDHTTAAILIPIYGILLSENPVAPTITGTPKTVTNVYNTYQFLPKAHDANNDTLTYSIQNKPSWAEFNSTTGLLQGIPSTTDEGNHPNIIISVTDGQKSVSLDAFAIKVGVALDIAHMYGKATQGTDSSYQYYAPASNTIDNNDSTNNHTSGGADGTNWLQIELPSPTKVFKIVLQNRSHSSRLTDAKIYLLDAPYTGTIDESKLIKTLTATNNEQIINIEQGMSGTYLLVKGEVRSQDDRHIHLKKLEVYGTVPKEPVIITTNQAITIDKWHNKVEPIFYVHAIDCQDDTLSYTLSGAVPFVINNKGEIRVNHTLDDASYTFNIIISDGINDVNQSLTVSIVENAIVNKIYRTNDNQPALSGLLPNIYNDGDRLSVDINGINYEVFSDGNAHWVLADDTITPALETGEYNLTLNVNESSIVYENYFEVYGERLQSTQHTVGMSSISDVPVTVNTSLFTPLVKDERVRGTDIRLYVENGVTKLENKSYRTLASLLAKYEDESNNTIFVKLNFSEHIKPYTDNNLSTFLHDTKMSIVNTANLFNGEFSFGGADCYTPTNENTKYCTPTTVNDTIYSDTAVQDDEYSEQQLYSIALSTYNHYFNSIDGLSAMKAWVYKENYKGMDFSSTYQGIDSYIGDEDKNAYLYRHFYNFTMPEHHVNMRSMRYKYAAQGMASVTSVLPLLGYKTSSGWASLWEGTIDLDGSSDYEYILHEIGHAYSYSHSSGMTYGWPHAFRKVIATLYNVKESPVFHVPKYVFSKKRKANNQIQFSLHKTTDALENEVTFEILSSAPLVHNDFVIQKSVDDKENQLTLSSDETLITRLFLRLYANDSQEVMSDILTPAHMTQTELVEDHESNKSYHVISHNHWNKTSQVMGTNLQPNEATEVCSAWFGHNASIAYETDAEKINSDFRTMIDNANWLNSKKLLGRIDAWWKYYAYDYSDDGYTKSWLTYNEPITDDTLGILCVKPKE
ncbi:MAG: Unknown protein [uncultured Sulfurovum sp.]|uniref:F5/8 type C domain-containing protein n=1 Tax=uncultured Sulfurovum sp. TaxID=269237 RepID=A0A6S6SRK8_9BACT|nr:MAG: Unknown protein [uncultured Sulfurovum sp.]